MNQKLKKILTNAIGFFFLAFGTFSMDYAIWREKPDWVFWICYVAMVLIGFGTILKLPSLIAAQISIVGIPLLIWNIDFFYQIIFHQSLWGVTDYYFTEMLPASRFISFEHFFVVPLGLVALWFIKLNKNNFWRLSLIQISILYFAIRFFTSATENVSCVFKSCVSFIPTNQFYPVMWFGLFILMITIASVLINNLSFLHKK